MNGNMKTMARVREKKIKPQTQEALLGAFICQTEKRLVFM